MLASISNTSHNIPFTHQKNALLLVFPLAPEERKTEGSTLPEVMHLVNERPRTQTQAVVALPTEFILLNMINGNQCGALSANRVFSQPGALPDLQVLKAWPLPSRPLLSHAWRRT